MESWGLNRFGMETVPPIVTRGVLVDVAAYKGVERLRKGYVITPADLEGAFKRQGVGIRAGDAVLFHTDWALCGVRTTRRSSPANLAPAWKSSAGFMSTG